MKTGFRTIGGCATFVVQTSTEEEKETAKIALAVLSNEFPGWILSSERQLELYAPPAVRVTLDDMDKIADRFGGLIRRIAPLAREYRLVVVPVEKEVTPV